MSNKVICKIQKQLGQCQRFLNVLSFHDITYYKLLLLVKITKLSVYLF